MSQSTTLAETRKPIPVQVYVMLLFGVATFSFAPILIRLAQGAAMPSILIAAGRLVLAALILTPITVTRYWQHVRQRTPRELGLALLAGLFLAIHFAAWVTSLEYTSVLVSVVFVTSSPLWVAILETVFLRVRLPRPVVIGLFIAIFGGLLIGLAGTLTGTDDLTINREREFIGGALSLVGALAVSAYIVIGRSLRAKMPVIPYIWLVYGFGGLILSFGVFATGTPVLGYEPIGYLWVLAMAVFPQLIGHSSLNYAVEYLPATVVSMVTQIEPIGSAILAFFLFGELPLPLQIVGSAIILVGVMLANLRNPNARTAQKKSDTS